MISIPQELVSIIADHFIKSHSDLFNGGNKNALVEQVGVWLSEHKYDAQSISNVTKNILDRFIKKHGLDQEVERVKPTFHRSSITIQHLNDCLPQAHQKMKGTLKENLESWHNQTRITNRQKVKTGKGAGKNWKRKTVNKDNSVYQLLDDRVYTGTSQQLARRALKKWDQEVHLLPIMLPGHYKQIAVWNACIVRKNSENKPSTIEYFKIYAIEDGVENKPKLIFSQHHFFDAADLEIKGVQMVNSGKTKNRPFGDLTSLEFYGLKGKKRAQPDPSFPPPKLVKAKDRSKKEDENNKS